MLPAPVQILAFRYLLFNKPFHVLSQFTAGTREAESKTLADFIPVPAVYPVGRLDFDSEGLLLLTDDGNFQHRLAHPLYGHPRTYWVQVEGTITPDKLTKLETGMVIQSYRTKPAKAREITEPDLPVRVPPVRFRKSIPTSWLELTLTEGRNRQVRRMTAAVGLPTLRLVRVAIGDLTLERLAPGDWRDLQPTEVAACLKQVKARRSVPRTKR